MLDGYMREVHVAMLRSVLLFRGIFPPYLNRQNRTILANICSRILPVMVENPSVIDEQNGSVITEDEAALYDRQIRLWGLDAQKR